MSKLDELQAELEQANEVTNEIAADVEDLLSRLTAGGLSPAEADTIKSQIVALTDRLRGVAAQHTPDPQKSAESKSGSTGGGTTT